MWNRWKHRFAQFWLDKALPPGRIIGGYQIETVLGRGSYGIAYLAKSLSDSRQVVIKQTTRSRKGHPKGLAMQSYEKKVLASLDHPRFPRLIDHFVRDGIGYLVMSHLPGTTVEQLLFEEKVTFSEAESVFLLLKLAVLVEHLHQCRIIHRDVRIPNVLLHHGEPYLIDFGLARFLGDPPTYVAESLDAYPEEKRLKREVHPSSDLYALGHFLLFLLYSTYEADEQQPERSWQEELTLSPEVRAILHKLLQIEGKYADVSGLIADLQTFLKQT